MGIALVQMRIMPEGLDISLEQIKKDIIEILNKNKVGVYKTEEQEIAFGLKAIILMFQIPESQAIDPIEEAIGKITGVNSAQITDMRRALG